MHLVDESTSDGISKIHWDSVVDLAESIATATEVGADESLLIKSLCEKLDELEKIYGRLPSILCTKADYASNVSSAMSLLKEAYAAAIEIDDQKNICIAVASLVELYLTELFDKRKALFWSNILSNHVQLYKDDYIDYVLRRYVTDL